MVSGEAASLLAEARERSGSYSILRMLGNFPQVLAATGAWRFVGLPRFFFGEEGLGFARLTT